MKRTKFLHHLQRFGITRSAALCEAAYNAGTVILFEILAEFEFGGQLSRSNTDNGYGFQPRPVDGVLSSDQGIAALRLELLHKE